MSEEISNPQAAQAGGVNVDHPRIREYGKNMAKQGMSKEEAAKRLGMPIEVVDKIYREAKEEK